MLFLRGKDSKTHIQERQNVQRKLNKEQKYGDIQSMIVNST